MSFHPNPISMAVHVEHRRLELLAQAEQERLAKEAVAGRNRGRTAMAQRSTSVFNRIRSLLAPPRRALARPVELSHPAPGEA